jgi:hypothetical protein
MGTALKEVVPRLTSSMGWKLGEAAFVGYVGTRLRITANIKARGNSLFVFINKSLTQVR